MKNCKFTIRRLYGSMVNGKKLQYTMLLPTPIENIRLNIRTLFCSFTAMS